MKNFNHPLMDNNISKSDVNSLIFFLKKNKKRIFTQSKKVNEFEILTQRHSNVRLIRGECSGVADARNMGLNQATGELISFVDSDDYVSQNFFEIQRFIHFTHPGIAATGTWLEAFGAHTRVYPQWDNFNPLGMRICLPPAGVLVWKKNAILELDGFDSNFSEGFEDFELLTRATLNNLLVIVVDSIEYFYQRGQKSLSQSWNSQKELDLLKQVLMNARNLCQHKYLEYIDIELEFGTALNYSSIDLIFNNIKKKHIVRNLAKKFRNNFFILSVWKVLPKFLRRFIFKLVSSSER
jgi:glycosyltransferase involved in cell wall biosynthesis